MTADIEERGIDEALIVDEKNRVMSGRVRLRIALDLRLPEVVITRRSSAEAASLIVQSLLQRRHYSKSALAYLAFPLFESMLVESRHRRVENLKQGAARPDIDKTYYRELQLRRSREMLAFRGLCFSRRAMSTPSSKSTRTRGSNSSRRS